MSKISEIQKLMTEVSDWANKTPRGKRSTMAILAQLSNEVSEAIDAARDVEIMMREITEGECHSSDVVLDKLAKLRERFAGCLILLLSATQNSGMTANSLITAAWLKHEINKEVINHKKEL